MPVQASMEAQQKEPDDGLQIQIQTQTQTGGAELASAIARAAASPSGPASSRLRLSSMHSARPPCTRPCTPQPKAASTHTPLHASACHLAPTAAGQTHMPLGVTSCDAHASRSDTHASKGDFAGEALLAHPPLPSAQFLGSWTLVSIAVLHISSPAVVGQAHQW